MTVDERIEKLVERHEALTARHEALTMTIELMSHDREHDNHRISALLTASEQDGEHIRSLVRIAELHHERLTRIEGSEA